MVAYHRKDACLHKVACKARISAVSQKSLSDQVRDTLFRNLIRYGGMNETIVELPLRAIYDRIMEIEEYW